MTSVEEDIELRDLVTQSLENNGVLAKIKAQLRASIFLTLEDENKFNEKAPFNNQKLKSHLESQDGKLMFLIVREFLEFFNLEYTISVFESESMFDSYYTYKNRSQIIEEHSTGHLNEDFDGPILLQLLHNSNNKHANVTFDKTANVTYDKINNATYDKVTNNDTFIKENSSAELTDDSHSKLEDISNLINTPKPITQIRTVKKETKFTRTEIKNDSEINDYMNMISPRSDISTNSNSINENFDKDDTFDGTSSIPEDSVRSTDSTKEKSLLIDLDKSISPVANVKGIVSPDNKTNLLDSTISEHSNKVPIPLAAFKQEAGKTEHLPLDKHYNDKTTTPLLPTAFKSIGNAKPGNSLNESNDRIKSPPLSIEKPKTLSSLSSLHDLPPLSLNKSRTTETILLPSLYSKDFKEKTASKQGILDLDFDSLDNYEEDFMSHSGSEADFSQNKTDLSLNLKLLKEHNSNSSKDSLQIDKIDIDKKTLLNNVNTEENFKNKNLGSSKNENLEDSKNENLKELKNKNFDLKNENLEDSKNKNSEDSKNGNSNDSKNENFKETNENSQNKIDDAITNIPNAKTIDTKNKSLLKNDSEKRSESTSSSISEDIHAEEDDGLSA